MTLTLALECSYLLRLVQDIIIINSCVKLNENRPMNEGVSDENVFFSSKNSHCDLDLSLIERKL